jgi:hypothetical protein
MDNFDLKRFLVENRLTRNSISEITVSNTPQFGKPTTTFDKLEPKSNTPSEPYTYDEPSLLDFVKKHIDDIEEDVTGHYHNTYPRQYSVNDVSEYEGIVFIGGNKNAPNIAILDHTPTQKDLEVTGTNMDDWRLEFSRIHIPGTDVKGPLKQGVNYIKKDYYWHARVPNEPTLKENKMNDFDLKRFLIENKMTRNSRLLNEQPEPEGIPADDPLAQVPAVPAETPSEPSGEIDKETAKELIFDTKGKFFTVTFIKKDGSERVMNARLGVKKYLRGGELRYDPAEFNYITVYDMGAKGYRMVNANTIKNLKIGKNEYVIPTAVSESQLDENKTLQDFKNSKEYKAIKRRLDDIAANESDISFEDAFKEALKYLKQKQPDLDFPLIIKYKKDIYSSN